MRYDDFIVVSTLLFASFIYVYEGIIVFEMSNLFYFTVSIVFFVIGIVGLFLAFKIFEIYCTEIESSRYKKFICEKFAVE